ncbi:MAG: GAF domain-containing protein [Cyanobacteria bacterium P01_D01_bin.36]
MNVLPHAPAKNLEELLHRMTDRIRKSLELPQILDATADEMRQFLGVDRVKVYQFHEDNSGEVVAEAIKEDRLPSLLGQRFPASDIPLEAREIFLTVRARSIVHVAKQEIGVSPLLSHTAKETLLSKLSFRSVDACHVEYLTAMGVASSLVVPILHRHRLWGLLVAHHSVPRRFGRRELEIVQLVADQVTVAISHASLLQLTRLQGLHESIINQVVSQLYSTVTNPLKRALEQMSTAMDCVGARLYMPTNKLPTGKLPIVKSASDHQPDFQVVTVGSQPSQFSPAGISHKLPHKLSQGRTNEESQQSSVVVLEKTAAWQAWLKAEASNQIVANLWAIADIETSELNSKLKRALSRSHIRSVLIARLVHQNRFLGYISLFRTAVDTETVWAGRLEQDTRQDRPRQSFEAWQEIKRNQSRPWTSREIGLAEELADRFASAIYQTRLYQEVQTLNVDLEQRVAQRTAELQQANEALRQEVAQRERAFEALETARESLRLMSHQNELILNAAGEGIYGIDPKGKIVFVNPAAAKILGHPAAALIGHFMHDVLKHSTPEGDLYSWKKSPIFQTIQHGRTHHVTGDLFQKNTGFSFPVEYVSTCIQEKGNIIGAVVIFQDITERQAIETMKDEFIAVVSHELRTPLTSIRAALGLLSQTKIEISPSKRQRMVEIAFSNTNRLVRLVGDILDMERIKLGKITLQPRECDLADIMVQAADEMRAMANKYKIKLSAAPLSVQINADPDRIIQTLTNLLSNAIKFSPAGSTVAVTAQTVNSQNIAKIAAALTQTGKAALGETLKNSSQKRKSLLLVQVKDQGQGVPEDDLEDIFIQFKQLDASDAKHKGGTGLGLAICRSIVQQHQGKIWAQSVIEQGSTFFFTLPL